MSKHRVLFVRNLRTTYLPLYSCKCDEAQKEGVPYLEAETNESE
jgi:hypothetical protein